MCWILIFRFIFSDRVRHKMPKNGHKHKISENIRNWTVWTRQHRSHRNSFFSRAAGEFHLPRPRWSSLDCQPLVFQHHPGRIEKRVQCRQIRPGGCQLDHMDKFTFKLFFASKKTTWREPLDLQQETTGDIFGPSWWFGTWILWLSHHIGNGKSSQLTPSFFRGVSSNHQPASNIIVNHH